MAMIRALALALIFKGQELFVFEGHDPVKADSFYRPLGGGIDFGESGLEAVQREFQEEIGKALIQVEYLETVENIFVYKGRPGHEIIRLYRAEFADPEVYQQTEVMGQEDNGKSFRALWVPLPDFTQGHKRLVPETLLPVLQNLKNA